LRLLGPDETRPGLGARRGRVDPRDNAAPGSPCPAQRVAAQVGYGTPGQEMVKRESSHLTL
ncbi:MAG TPA: hypothetical protein VGN19_14510, partial [Pedococcus sp.]|nr:hypothetical protein [Pedococcus sp.]